MSIADQGTYSETFGAKFHTRILAVAVQDPTFVARYRTALDYSYFTSDVERVIARALFNYVDTYNGIPSRTTLTEDIRPHASPDDMDAIEAKLKSLFHMRIKDSAAVIDKAVEFGKQQAMINAVIEAGEELDKGNRGKILPLIQQAMVIGDDILDVGIDYNDAGDLRQALYVDGEGDRDVITTGLPHLDFAMGGGLGRGELGIILAPPKRGKSTTLLNFAYGALRAGLNVVYYTYEMSDKKIMSRVDDRVVTKGVKYKRKAPRRFLRKLNEEIAAQIKGHLFVKQYPSSKSGVTTIRNHLNVLRAHEFIPDMIVVDYADLLEPESNMRYGKRYQDVEGIYRDLRSLAGEHHAALWTGSQSKVSSLTKDTLDMSDFAEAFAKAAIMDAGIALCQTLKERASEECRLAIVGQRNEDDARIVRCHIRRDQCLLTSTQLIDFSETPIYVPKVDNVDDVADQVAAVSRTKRVEKLKKKAGIRKRPVKVSEGWKKKKKQKTSKTVKKRQFKKPSKHIGDML